MKEINRVFFGEKGITSTSANHLANLAKECMESNRRALEGALKIVIPEALTKTYEKLKALTTEV